MNDAMIESSLRSVLGKWPLYSATDHVQVARLSDGWSIGYCGEFDGVPFTSSMRIAKEPPNYLSMNIKGDILYLLFIQVERNHRGQEFGSEVYKIVPCVEVDQI